MVPILTNAMENSSRYKHCLISLFQYVVGCQQDNKLPSVIYATSDYLTFTLNTQVEDIYDFTILVTAYTDTGKYRHCYV